MMVCFLLYLGNLLFVMPGDSLINVLGQGPLLSPLTLWGQKTPSGTGTLMCQERIYLSIYFIHLSLSVYLYLSVYIDI